MKVILLGFLSLLTFAETTRKFTSPDVELPGDYWEEEKEDDDEEKTTNVEHSPEISARAPVSHLDDGVDLLKKTMQNLQEKVKFTSTEEEEDESSQEEQALESRLGPQYLTTLIQSHREEELPLDVSHKADLLERNTAQETRKEDCKVNVVLIVSCVAVDCVFIALICCWMAFIKYRVKTWIASTGFRGKFP